MTVYDDLMNASSGTRVVHVLMDTSSSVWDDYNGTTLAADVTISQAINDLSETVTGVTGTASAEASVTFAGGNATATHLDLSPFSTSPDSMRAKTRYGIGKSMQVLYQVFSDADPISSVADRYLFNGQADGFAPGEDATTLRFLDAAGAMQGTVTLPAAAGFPERYGYGDTRINPISIVDLAMRSAGKYITPPIREGAVLSVPGVGAGLAEIGTTILQYPMTSPLTTPWAAAPTLQGYSNGLFTLASPVKVGGATPVRIETWTTVAPGGDQYVLELGNRVGDTSTATEFWVEVLATGAIRVGCTSTGATATTATGVWPSGDFPALHYMWVIITAGQVTIRVDGTNLTPLSLSMSGATATSASTTGGPYYGLQVWVSPNSFTSNNTWGPNYESRFDPVSARLNAVSRQSLPEWQAVQQVAKAYGDVAWFDLAGVFRYEIRATWKARRYGTPLRQITDSDLFDGLPEWGSQSQCRSVSASVVTPQMKQSTLAAPAWQATETYTCPARSTVSVQVDLDYQVHDLKPMDNGVAANANSSWRVVIAASSVGDPAATPVTGVSVTAVPNATGFVLTIRNSLPYAVALYDPASDAPYLVLHGKTIRWPDPKVWSRSAATTGKDLVLDDNPWRQDAARTAEWLDDLAAEVAYPQVIWPQITVTFDPRITVGTVLLVFDARHMDVAHPVQVVGVSINLPAGEDLMHTMTLTVRGAYAPTGLIIGVMSLTVGTSRLVQV